MLVQLPNCWWTENYRSLEAAFLPDVYVKYGDWIV